MARPTNFRHRSSSGGSHSEMMHSPNTNLSDCSSVPLPTLVAASNVLNMALHLKDVSGKSFLHSIDSTNVAVAKVLLDRAQQVDLLWKTAPKLIDDHKQQHLGCYYDKMKWLQDFLLHPDEESGYTPLHWAVWNKNIVAILLLLRHALNAENVHSVSRFTHRPILLIEGDTTANELAQKMAQAVDNEGLTPLQLMQYTQRQELEGCRKSLPRPSAVVMPQTSSARLRRPSFDDANDDDDDDEQNEFAPLRRDMRLLARLNNNRDRSNRNTDNNVTSDDGDDTYDLPKYGCEVLTYGPANHCALGVPQGGGGGKNKVSALTQFRPQRVQAFGLDASGRLGSAVAVAASTHHTLVATRDGHLYAFGLGTGGRLGTGDERHRPLPTRLMGALSKRHVVAIAAAENHSLCVTSDGNVFAWGSNRFGQLAVTSNDESETTRCLPRRVDELKQVYCVAVAAGEKHSVALSRKGEVYVWGENSAGQLGISRRSGSQRVQRVDALWNSTPSKPAIAVAASGLSTLALIAPTMKNGPNVNAVYSWGHGNQTPIKVQFGITRGGNQRSYHVNPVAIACAKYHNVVVTANGRVYTWGLHKEPLGTGNAKKSSAQSMVIASPQLVTGMLPENGGGVVVAVSASENHTAVLTDGGSLFTWGASQGNEVLGHEGVRWQPIPKRVPGVHRAVALASAKEHTVLLIGASFPSIPIPSSTSSLEYRCAAVVAQHVDLFNVIPVLIMSERSQNHFLIGYCQEFVRRNLDGVLNLGRKSEMNSYLDEQLADGLHTLFNQERDHYHHPFTFDVVTAGNRKRASFRAEVNCSGAEWAKACQLLEKRLPTSSQVKLRVNSVAQRRVRRSRSTSFHEDKRATKIATGDVAKVLETNFQGCSDRCLMLTASMDLSSRDAVKEKYECLTKEVRGTRKRLNQIVKLIDAAPLSEPLELSAEQQEKVSRRPLLQADLSVLERALERVTQRMREYNLLCNQTVAEPSDAAVKTDDDFKEEKVDVSALKGTPLRCPICDVECPDENSYTFHLNGRKHRNRVLQAEEDEKKQKAVAMMQERQKGSVKWDNPISSELHKSSSDSNPSLAPAYKLPPPPHPVVDVVEPSNTKVTLSTGKWASPSCPRMVSKGFRDILEEESKKATSLSKPDVSGSPPLSKQSKSPPWKAQTTGTPVNQTKQVPTLSSPLQQSPWAAAGNQTLATQCKVPRLPKGPAASLKSPSSATIGEIQTPTKVNKVMMPFLTGAVHPVKSPTCAPVGGSPIPVNYSPELKLPVGSAPPLKSPPWMASGVHFSQVIPVISRIEEGTPTADEETGRRGGISLGDFMTKSPGAPALAIPAAAGSKPKSAPMMTWSLPKNVPAVINPKQQSKSLLEIQQEEETYNQVQGQSPTINKWYVGRREKAGSLAEIQQEDSKERELRLLIEEQKQIEEQIHRERERQEKLRIRPKRRNLKSPKPKNVGVPANASQPPRAKPNNDMAKGSAPAKSES